MDNREKWMCSLSGIIKGETMKKISSALRKKFEKEENIPAGSFANLRDKSKKKQQLKDEILKGEIELFVIK